MCSVSVYLIRKNSDGKAVSKRERERALRGTGTEKRDGWSREEQADSSRDTKIK